MISFLIVLSTSSLKSQSYVVDITQTSDTIYVTFNLTEYQIADTSLYDLFGVNELYKYITLNDFGIIDDPGFPEVPQFSFDLAVPNNSYGFSVISDIGDSTIIFLDKKMMPSQEIPEVGNPVFAYNTAYYNSNGEDYSFLSKLSEPYFTFSQKGITLSIFPFQYNPQLNKLTAINSGSFKIVYQHGAPDTNIYTSLPREQYLQSVFTNYSELKTGAYHVGRYLMVTPPAYEETLTYFANYKRNLGYTVEVVSTNTTGTTAENIKDFLQARYDGANTRPDFVLLIGDTDVIPASGGSTSSGTTKENYNDDYTHPLTDLNYSLLSGNDYFADVFLGRWSISTNDELQRIINKSIYMESNLHRFQERAVFLAGGGDGAKKFKKVQQWVIEKTFEPEGWVCDEHYAFDGATYQDGLDAINGNYPFLLYRGHGGYSQTGTPFSISNFEINTATNILYPMVFSFACLTNCFGFNGVCLGEEWIRSTRGGISFFGATTTTLRTTNNNIEEKVFGDAFTDEEQIAAMTTLGMKRYWLRFWSSFTRTRCERHMKSYNLLGDPSFNKSGIGCIENLIFNQNEIFHDGDSLTYQANNNILNASDFLMNSGSGVNLIAGNSIMFLPGFRASLGSDFHSFISPCTDDFLLKSQMNRNKIASKEQSKKNDVIKSTDLICPYPNPFDDKISFKIELVEDSKITLIIYNSFGQNVLTAINNVSMKIGVSEVTINTENLPSGIYLYSAYVNEKKITGKIIKTK